MHRGPSIRVVLNTFMESHLINIHDFQVFQPINVKNDGIQGILLVMSQSLPGVLKRLPLLSRYLFLVFIIIAVT